MRILPSAPIEPSVAAVPGSGWSLNFGTIPSGNGSGEGGFVMTNGLVIAY